jgi:integrase
MARYKKGADGNYRASIVIGKTETGGQKRKTVKAKTIRELELRLADLKLQFNRGYDFDASKVTVEQWSDNWLRLYKDPGVGVKEQQNARSILNKHILPQIGHFTLSDVKPFHLQGILNLQSGTSKSNTMKIGGLLNQMFGKAKQGGLLLDNPAEFLEMPFTTSVTRRSLTDDERDAVLDVCKTHRAGLWVLLMLMCGLRRGETVPLTWGDINFKTGMLTISKAVEFVNNKPISKAPKTKSGNRTIPIPLPLFTMLIDNRGRDNEHIFTPAMSSGMLTETNCVRLWNSFFRALDICMGAKLYRNQITQSSIPDKITPHNLRHTYATDLFVMGVDLKTAQYLLGHADIKTTANIYTHMRVNMLATVQDKQAAFYSQNDTAKIRAI